MKKLITLFAAILAASLLVPVAEAGHVQRRVVGYNTCGDAVYATWRVVSYQRCGTPNYGWVRDRVSSSCTRPGRCNHHGHARTRTVRSSSSCNSRSRIGYVTPRVTIRSSSIRPYTSSRSFRNTSTIRRSTGVTIRSPRGISIRSSRSRSCR